MFFKHFFIRMLALLRRFRLDFNEVIVITDSEKQPHTKKYVYTCLKTTFWTNM